MTARALRALCLSVALSFVALAPSCAADDETREVAVQSARKGAAGASSGGSGGGAGAGGDPAEAGGGGASSGGAPAGKGGAAGKGSGGATAGGSSRGGLGGTAGKGGSASAGKGSTAGSGPGSSGGGAGKGLSGGGGGAEVPATYLAIVKPTPGQVHLQAGQPPSVDVSYEVVAGSAIKSVEYVIETDFSLGKATTAPGFDLTYPYAYPGDRLTTAHGFDEAGTEIATATIAFVVKGPGGGSGGAGQGGSPSTGECLADLDALGIAYTKTNARGVVDAVKLSGPLNGVLYAKTDTDTPSADPIACEFIKTLYAFAGLAKERGFVKIGTLGAYCYRCCCAYSATNFCRDNDDPEPDCSGSGYSNHSFGRALDIRYLYKADGTRYDLNDPVDFVKWKNEDETCGAALAAQKGKSKELYALACEASAKKIFGIILTPNHNAAHRNHFHADTGKSGTPGSFAVKSFTLPQVDGGALGDE